MVTTLIQELRDFEARARAVFEPLLEKALKTELLTETSDPDCIVGRRYDPAVVYVGQLLLGGWACQVSLLRTIYDLTGLYGAADEVIYARYRQLCERVWMMSPFLRRLETVIGVASMTAFYLTFEAANAIEKEYLLDLFIDLDKYQQRYPKDRADAAAFVMLRAHLLTGRVFLN
jgi:hypothetical protein